MEYFVSPTPNFQELCASYQGSRQILSRREHVPNKWCALNNDVCLITRFYSKLYYTLQLSQYHSHFEFFLQTCFGMARILHGTIPHIRCKIPSSFPPVLGTCKIFQFCPFCSLLCSAYSLAWERFISSSSKHLSRCALITECLKSRHWGFCPEQRAVA